MTLTRYMSGMYQGRFISATCLLALCCLGCGTGTNKSDALTNLAPVTGKLQFKGEAPAGAVLTFFPEDQDATTNEVVATAVVESDGSYEARTIVPEGSAKGVAPGKYLLTVSWTKPVNPRDSDSALTPELLPNKLQSPKTSELKVDVVPGKNEIPLIEIKP